MKSPYEFSQTNKRPSSQEGFDILSEIVVRQKLEYVAQAFHVYAQTVKKWFLTSNDLFTRIKIFLQRLVEDGHGDLAIRLTQFWCSAIGRESVPQAEKQASFLSLLQAVTANGKDASEVQIAFSRMVDDQVADLKEIRHALHEVEEEIESARRLSGQLKFLESEALENGGKVIIDMRTLRRLVVQQ